MLDSRPGKFEENLAFAVDPQGESEILRFQLMQGGHAFQAAHLWRFGGLMAFRLDSARPRSRRTISHLFNSAACRLFDLLVHKRYLLWLVWNHIGYWSWKYQTMREVRTIALPNSLPPLPPHVAASVTARYGRFTYCRYFEYAARDRYVVYWVVLERNGAIVILEESDGWVGRWGQVLDVTFGE